MQQLGLGLLYMYVRLMYYTDRRITDTSECAEMGSGNSDTSSELSTNQG